MKPKTNMAPTVAEPQARATQSSSGVASDAQHAAAIFGSIPRRPRAPDALAKEPTATSTAASLPCEADAAINNVAQPIWLTLSVGSVCLARLDESTRSWSRVRVVGTIHAGFANMKCKVVPENMATTGVNAAPREMDVSQLVETDAAKLRVCKYFDAATGFCRDGLRCRFAHLV